ncbi:helix-turn-helix domain-containing protein [Streptomyces sp. UG1]|uniref:helix-turn-helix domain-containing protein n=1 Tax=Streptomyces sp. UG1 TaxID=3417652 RepID=UPI003CE9A362
MPLLSDELFAVPEQELAKGPVAHGWPDQTWTLSRIKTLIGRRFHESYTVQSVAALLKRHGWSCQVPARRAVERDEAAVAGWVKETWPSMEGPWRRSMPGSRRCRSLTTWTCSQPPNPGAGSNVCSAESPVLWPRRWPRRVSGPPRTFGRSLSGCTTACEARSVSVSRSPSRT